MCPRVIRATVMDEEMSKNIINLTLDSQQQHYSNSHSNNDEHEKVLSAHFLSTFPQSCNFIKSMGTKFVIAKKKQKTKSH